MYILKIFTFQHILFLIFSKQHTNPSPRTGPQDLLVTHYDCEENEQKNTTQIRYKSSHTMRIRTTSHRNNKYKNSDNFPKLLNNHHQISPHQPRLKKIK